VTPRPADAPAVVRAVDELARQHPGRTVFVGIDGFGGAGKTTLAAAIGGGVHRAVVVHVDDFAGPGVVEWDWARFRAQVVRPLLDGRVATYQVWDWGADTGGDWCEIVPGSVVVVEGVSSTRREAGVDWLLTVWVEAPASVRRARAIERDGEQVWSTRWVPDWIPHEQAYAARERPRERADLVVSTDPAGPGTMEAP
jgi:uridine kinase